MIIIIFWQVKSSLSIPSQLTSFLAASFQHSGDWLHVMPTSSCGLKLDDEAVGVGVGLRLGLPLRVPHKCHYGSLVDSQGLHGFVCKKASGRSVWHHALNDLVAGLWSLLAFQSPKSHVVLAGEIGSGPTDGLFPVPWEAGKPFPGT